MSEAWQKRGHQFTNSLQLMLHFVSDEGALFVSDEAVLSDLVLVPFSDLSELDTVDLPA